MRDIFGIPPVKQKAVRKKNVKAQSVKKEPVRKETIPKALKEQTWLIHAGPVFKRKCLVTWCTNEMTVFDFHTGHNIPEAKGGTLDISNLRPICARCNLSMGATYTIAEWNLLGPAQHVKEQPKHWLRRYFCWEKNFLQLRS
jgi:5-methylcytosine-specific restriction endonuclease McrA